MGIQITNYNLPLDQFNALEERFPEGDYHLDDPGTKWFNVTIVDQNLRLSWFLDGDGIKALRMEALE
tara:strand:- start:1530 stop:1730 length:201 start_codon:yes stop_codon:yes gene_type:complete